MNPPYTRPRQRVGLGINEESARPRPKAGEGVVDAFVELQRAAERERYPTPAFFNNPTTFPGIPPYKSPVTPRARLQQTVLEDYTRPVASESTENTESTESQGEGRPSTRLQDLLRSIHTVEDGDGVAAGAANAAEHEEAARAAEEDDAADTADAALDSGRARLHTSVAGPSRQGLGSCRGWGRGFMSTRQGGVKPAYELAEEREDRRLQKHRESRERHAQRFFAAQQRRRQEWEALEEEREAEEAEAEQPDEQQDRRRGAYKTWVKDGWLPHIHRTLRHYDSIGEGVRYLQQWKPCFGGQQSRPFLHLSRTTVISWYKDPDGLVLKDALLPYVQGSAHPSTWRTGQHHGKLPFSERQPELIAYLKVHLQEIRDEGRHDRRCHRV